MPFTIIYLIISIFFDFLMDSSSRFALAKVRRFFCSICPLTTFNYLQLH